MNLDKSRLVGLAAMLDGALGVALGPFLAHLYATYPDDYGAYGKLEHHCY